MSNLESQQQAGGVLRTLDFVRRAAHVKRYHTEVVIKEQNVGEHTFNVIWLCYLLTRQHPTTALLMHAAAHDAAEHATGDIPSPTKRALGIRTQVATFEAALMAEAGLNLPTLDDHSAHILKLADALDGVLFSLREHNLGNRLINVVFRNYCAYVREELQSYRNKFGEVFGEGAEYVETVAMEILLHAEGQFKSVLTP
jgi:5'-deoxynucleotidase YfbR-like HD superfamily hydrolase